jgi:hypothetical protein
MKALPHVLIVWLSATLAPAATLHFGTNIIVFGTPIEFDAPLSARGRMEIGRLGLRLDSVRGALAVPENFDLRKPWPLLVISVPSGGRAIPALNGYTNVALHEGWCVLAADGPRVQSEQDTIYMGYGVLSSVTEYLARTWPMTKQWPVACAGFSGGAKRSGAVAAALARDQWRVIGMFMGGCNEDWATLGYEIYKPGASFKNLPIFLSSGDTDAIAGPDSAAAVKQVMERSGFTKVRLESYPGGHRLDSEQLRAALQWFRPARGASQ